MNSSFFDVDSSESSRQLAFTTSDEYLYEDRDDTQELQQNDFTATQSAGVSGESWCVTESDTCTQPANLVGHTNACDSLRSLHQSHLQCVQNVASEVDVTCDTLTYESQQWPISQEHDVTAERVSDSPAVHEQTHHNALDSTLGLPESEDEDELSNLIMVANDDDDDECETSTANIECGEAGESLSPINDELVGTVPNVRRAGGRGAMSDHDDAVEHHLNSSVRAKSAKQQSSRMSAYLLWASEMRESAIQQNPHMDFAQINKRLGAMWNSLSEAKKFSYKHKAQRLNRSAAAAASGVVDSDGLSCGPPTGATLSGCAKMKSTGRWASSRHQTDTVASSLTNNTSSTSTEPLDLAAHLLLLGESLSVVGHMEDSSCEAQEQHTHQYYRRLNESLKVKAACIIAHAQSALQDQVDESVVDCGSISSSDEGHSSTDDNVLFIEQKHKAQCEERDYQPTPVSVLCDSDSPLTETDSGIAGAIGSADVKTQVAFYRTSFLAASKEQERLKNELTVLHKEKAELTNKLKCYHDNSINLRSCTDNQSSRIDNLSRALESSRLECAQGRSKVVQLEKLCATNERKVQCSCKVQSQQQVRLDRAQQQVTKLAAQVQELERKLIEQRRQFNECTKRLEADKQQLHRHNQQLVVGFKTQMRLIDVLKKQKLHLQAAKLLQISEAEFLKTIGSDLESS